MSALAAPDYAASTLSGDPGDTLTGGGGPGIFGKARQALGVAGLRDGGLEVDRIEARALVVHGGRGDRWVGHCDGGQDPG